MSFTPEGNLNSPKERQQPKSDKERIAVIEAAEAAEVAEHSQRAEVIDEEEYFTEEEMQNPQSIGCERMLGEDFDAEAMEGMFSVWPTEVVKDGWNDYLEVGDNVKGLPPLETSLIIKLFKKIPGVGDSKSIFPIFLKFLQDHYTEQGFKEVITPEEAQQFHNYMESMHGHKRTI